MAVSLRAEDSPRRMPVGDAKEPSHRPVHVQMGAAVQLTSGSQDDFSPRTPERRRHRPSATRELEPIYVPFGKAARTSCSSFAAMLPARPGEIFHGGDAPRTARMPVPHAAPGALFDPDVQLPLNPRDVVKCQEDAVNGWLASMLSGCHSHSQIQQPDAYKEPIYVTLARDNEIA
eukprot:TRINITY_DN43315_c0_g1_i1.p1 TRINITY_DN43315_c0_g1~~TRINITY_DN43315_c0_g1_i1.p1  ORF type:complete len:197 (-),score=31.21 TRINITY_DN43315_c0_g1_i1:503-1027(-)